ncbi:penicillin-binding protein 2 [Paroceanicella profunda]|uniref:Penicillin-binding protein 2 n=1 Tax=Paroceanicella profunda TaxID=2579971 RepID=A0A5B8FGC1_9RHOB|nr:penicillin-binding protein 2 [Paroceanicella profunda]QDL90678.1 penicillin-binding protein 2 [Paroceanicella profunda]
MSRQQFPKKDGPRISRRGLLLLGGQLGVVGVLGWRMRQLQVENSERYRLLAEENRINMRLIPPARGLIFDREGRALAVNRQNYRIVMIREQAGDPEEALNRLASLIEIPEAQRARVLKEVRQKSAFVPVTVAEHLNYTEFARVSANSPALPGIIPEVGLSRFYPEREATSHLVGYVGPVSEKDLKEQEDPDPLLQIPRFQIGKTGVEKLDEGKLRGHAGLSRIEVNSVGRVMRELDRTEGTAGANLQLTIDLDLQNFALQRLAGQSAAAVVMDVHTGDLMAMASAPGFDPNLFVFGISSTNWNGLLNDPYRPLSNKSVSGAYPPGSTFKMTVALAALADGAATVNETVFCPGYMEVGNRRFHCWRRGGHGHMNLHDGLKNSCDVYFYEMARRVGIDKISAMANRLGIGVRHDLPLPAISEGLTPTRDWKQRTQNQSWLVGDSINAGIGQGYVLATPLQLAVMSARVATGRAVVPRLVRGVDSKLIAPEEAPDIGLDPRHLAAVRGGMNAVVNERHGTGWRSRIEDDSLAMAGKSGTSQVRQISAEERRLGVFRNEDLPWNRRDHALFVAYAPVQAPRFAVSVIVEHGGGGSSVCAPICRDLLLQALYKGPPPLSAYPASDRDEIEQRRALQPEAPARPAHDRA